jgi:hypothetical protein
MRPLQDRAHSSAIVNIFSSSSFPSSYLLRALIILQHIYSVRSAHPIPSSIRRTHGKVSVKKTPCDHGSSIIACYVRYVEILRPNQRCLDLETRLAKANPAFAATPPRSFVAQLLEQSIPTIPTIPTTSSFVVNLPRDPLSFLHIFMSFSLSTLLHTCNLHRI